MRRCAWMFLGGGECGDKNVTHLYVAKGWHYCRTHARNMMVMGFVLRRLYKRDLAKAGAAES